MLKEVDASTRLKIELCLREIIELLTQEKFSTIATKFLRSDFDQENLKINKDLYIKFVREILATPMWLTLNGTIFARNQFHNDDFPCDDSLSISMLGDFISINGFPISKAQKEGLFKNIQRNGKVINGIDERILDNLYRLGVIQTHNISLCNYCINLSDKNLTVSIEPSEMERIVFFNEPDYLDEDAELWKGIENMKLKGIGYINNGSFIMLNERDAYPPNPIVYSYRTDFYDPDQEIVIIGDLNSLLTSIVIK